MKLRLGTRGSALAKAQSQMIADAVTAATGRTVELVEIVTPGDRSAAPVQRLGVGVFVSALRDALQAKEIDFAVHSYKDLPTAPVDDLIIAAVPERADPRDVLVARDGLTLAELPPSSVVGTGALRRIAQLQALGLGLRTTPIRGNVDSRLRRVASGELDAIVLAKAGLDRLGRSAEATEALDPMLMLPAPAQGALAVECRADDNDLVEALSALDHPATRAAVAAERGLLAQLEAGCSAPIAGLAEISEDEIYLRGAVFSEDGRHAIRLSRTGTIADADQIGRLLAADLLAAGADRLFSVGGGVPSGDGETDENDAVPGSAQ
ncbi:hydroxymethylbilane synthase [Hamadaea flava]|uniref:Porphobilinogen deaminase n=1 Tax=Hamadaea flava TaxID=1742688 RepID=A0ABV8LFP0_9ACTN|nr:hydroxymethylbilane synthase [Hamadaea flava]MCP2326471.1 hydroxymethylbilane synthase [Hamadaea flava]